nr:hypothetical protein GCM10020092_086170 [Actinoplanes digitatis]
MSTSRSGRCAAPGAADGSVPGATVAVEDADGVATASGSSAQAERAEPTTAAAGVASNGTQPKPSR